MSDRSEVNVNAGNWRRGRTGHYSRIRVSVLQTASYIVESRRQRTNLNAIVIDRHHSLRARDGKIRPGGRHCATRSKKWIQAYIFQTDTKGTLTSILSASATVRVARLAATIVGKAAGPCTTHFTPLSLSEYCEMMRRFASFQYERGPLAHGMARIATFPGTNKRSSGERWAAIRASIWLAEGQLCRRLSS